LITHGHESLVGYNVQSVVDDANKLIVHTEVTNENDINALGQLVEDTHELLTLEPNAEVLADKGYHNAAELQKVRDLGHKTFVAERRHAANHKEGNYSPSDFCYDEDQDAYICPAGELLKPPVNSTSAAALLTASKPTVAPGRSAVNVRSGKNA
jgi:hypothetical protein